MSVHYRVQISTVVNPCSPADPGSIPGRCKLWGLLILKPFCLQGQKTNFFLYDVKETLAKPLIFTYIHAITCFYTEILTWKTDLFYFSPRFTKRSRLKHSCQNFSVENGLFPLLSISHGVTVDCRMDTLGLPLPPLYTKYYFHVLTTLFQFTSFTIFTCKRPVIWTLLV